MKRAMRFYLAIAVLLAFTATVDAQLTLPNSANAIGGPLASTTVGSLHSFDTTTTPTNPPATFLPGNQNILRAAGAANASYMPTGWAIDPTFNGSITGVPTSQPGFTIEFWWRPANPGTFQYICGDSFWTGASGSFRMFANGNPGGPGSITVRGPLSQLATLGGTIQASLDANGWMHLALRYDFNQQRLELYINGTLNTTVQNNNIQGVGSDFTCMGYNGSASAGPEGNFEEVKLFDYARDPGDITAEYIGEVAGGTSAVTGELDWPTKGYYQFNSSTLNSHIGLVATNGEAKGTGTRLVAPGMTMEWGVDTTAAGPFLGTCFMQFTGPSFGGVNPNFADPRTLAFRPAPATAVAHSSSSIGLAGLEIGHTLSSPALTSGDLLLAFPDALGVGFFVGAFPLNLFGPYAYGTAVVPPIPHVVPLPPGLLAPGDRIDLQWITLDPTYSGVQGPANVGVATSNRATIFHMDSLTGPHFHAEARGVSVINDPGFWELWNTGDVDITQVSWDLRVTGPTGPRWNPGGALNTGGTLAAGTSYRFSTEQYTALVFAPGTSPNGFTPINTAPNGLVDILQFDFTGFSKTVDHFIFDCDTSSASGGAAYIGALVTVTFANGVTLSGNLAADPADPQGAILDL